MVELKQLFRNYVDNETKSQLDSAILISDPSILYDFYIDYNKLDKEFKNELFKFGDFNPINKIFTDVVKSKIAELDDNLFKKISNMNIKARFSNFMYNKQKNDFSSLIPIRSISSAKMGSFVYFKGVIRNIIINKSSIKKLNFHCINCNTDTILDFNDIDSNFNGKTCFACQQETLEVIPVIGGAGDYQTLVIEELSNESNNTDINVVIDGDLVNKFELGDNVIVTGNIRLNVFEDEVINQFKKQMNDHRIYKHLSSFGGSMNGIDTDWFVEANFVEQITDSNIMFDTITKEDIKQIKAMSTDHHLMEKTIQSFAPDIYGYDIVKEALIYQLVGGLGRSRNPKLDKRGEIHIFLLGDPSTAKTDLMLWALDIAQKKRFAYGGNMSKVGLTGGAEKVGEKWVLTAGVASIADMGLLGIDEMNDTPAEVLSALKEIMEKQTSTTTKIRAGSNHTRVSVIGSANPPKGNRYNKFKSFFENLGINLSLFTRFDYVALFRDIPNPEIDSKVVDKIIDSYEMSNQPPYSKQILAKYIYYVKNYNKIPKLSQAAKDRVHAYYVKIRTLDMNENIKNLEEQENVSITARQIQSLLRFGFASAIFQMKDEVDDDDIRAGERIVNDMLNKIGIDPETGKVDASILMGSKSSKQMNRETVFKELLDEMSYGYNNKIDYDQFYDELRKRSHWKPDEIEDEKVHKYIEKCERQHIIMIVNHKISVTNYVSRQDR